MIFGPHFHHNLNRIQPIDPDRQDEDQREGKKKKVLHQGRTWTEAEEDLPLQPTIPQSPPPARTRRSNASGVYADRALLERAHSMFVLLTTVEAKAAQLCFLKTEAIYDSDLQHEVELFIQTWQIGGVLFHKGEYRRQAYLIERFQDISKIPLLIANDFLHGLSFYLQGASLIKEATEQHYSDLGKAVMVQNRRLGAHIQFDRNRGDHDKQEMNEIQAKAFRKGIRGAHGIVGKEKRFQYQESSLPTTKGFFSPLLIKDIGMPGASFSELQVQETIGVKTLTFLDMTLTDKGSIEEEICKGFKQLYDVFLLSGNISEAIRTIARLVRSGKISEDILDRHVMKALIIKSHFFK